jgi:KipI family sensor histidine kinase inhibitor
MTAPTWACFPAGDNCLVIEAQGGDVLRHSAWAAAVAVALRAADIAGVIEVVPAMRTVGLHYAPASLRSMAAPGEIAYQTLVRLVSQVMQSRHMDQQGAMRMIDIPVCYGGTHGPDLEEAAQACGLAAPELVALHAQGNVAVQMIGFAPGHPYIGTFDSRLSLPRRSQPRTSVPTGSIGLANRQSVIYPLELPGGWNLIGRTPLKLFDPLRQPACLLQPGDQVRFVPISPEEFAAMEGVQ